MKKVFLTLIILVTTLGAMAQATQPCVVKQYNQKQQKTPLAGVQVEVRDAGSAASGADGRLTLSFRTLKPGDRVPFRAATKAGFELMNKTAVEQWNISRDQKPFEIVLIQSAYFTQLKGKLKQSSVDSYHKKYEKARADLEKLQKEGKLKEQEYYDKLNELEDRYDSQLKNLDTYVDQFARIDLSELSEQEQRFLELAHAGRLDEAAEAYNSLNAAGKYITAVENVRKLNEDIAKLEDEKVQQQEAAKTFFAMLQRQVNTLKLAGGEENYKKAGDLLKRAALADTTNVLVVEEYADFAYCQNDFKEAEQFLIISLMGREDNPYHHAISLHNLGALYANIHDYAKAEGYFLKALENYTKLYTQNPDTHLRDLAGNQNDMGLMYRNMFNFTKAEEYYLKALENYTQLYIQNPDTYRTDIAMNLYNLGSLYTDTHDYAKAEEYLIKALDHYTLLFSLNPNNYRDYLANTQNSLGNLYSDLHNYAKAEEYYLNALENKMYLFNQNPDAYRNYLANTQGSLGNLYSDIHNYAKAEEYYLNALENYTQLFSLAPDAFRANLAMIQDNLGNLYDNLEVYTKAGEYFTKALENRTYLFAQNPEVYRYDLASTLNNIGIYYEHLNDYAKAEEYHVKALEHRIQLFKNNPDTYRFSLAMSQYNLGEMYFKLQNYIKAEEFDLEALENYTILFNQSPNAYRDYLARTLWNLMLLYGNMENWEKFDDILEQTLKNFEDLSQQAPQYQEKVDILRELKRQRSIEKAAQ